MQGFEISLQLPDLWQQEAVRALRDGKDVIVDAPTGAGKTWVFELFVKDRKLKGEQAVYTVPTRALANDKWREWRHDGLDVGIATGDLAENLDAPVLVATLETQRERLLAGGEGLSLLAIDEYQMLADKARGLNYELAIALAPPGTQLLLLSGSVQNPGDVAEWMRRIGRDVALVETAERPVPLEELPVEELPRLPEKTGAFWPRVVAGACLADLAPMLLFSPRREAAETLARKIAAALPDDDPIELPPQVAARAGKFLTRLLRSRVAFHHSGLDYETRATVVEPLAKAGQLRAIVATTGLAAGINFSVRSVAVTETSYRDGAFLRELRPDELLQMFGRAGRRGLDEMGYVISARSSPRLYDAAPLRLRRVNQIDWPNLLRVMAHAVASGGDPLDAAAVTCRRLFSDQKLLLGVEPEAGDAEGFAANAPLAGARFDGPRREEFQNPDGVWEAIPEHGSEQVPLGDAWLREDERWVAALESKSFVRTLGCGRPCRVAGSLGLEIKVGRLGKAKAEGGVRSVVPLAWVKKATGMEGRSEMAREEFAALVIPELGPHFEVGVFRRLVRRGAMLAAQLDLRATTVEAIRDESGRGLIDAPTRSVAVDVATQFQAEGRAIDPPSGSAAHSWRKLGLVDEAGRPTARGEIVSVFQGGEGLVVAAALEDESYPIDELLWHLANLRGGYRFRDAEGGGSSRLAAVTRAAYGMVDHPGYLQLGMPPGYGEGTAEVLVEVLLGKGVSNVELSAGDIERAKVEWLSLLRHVANLRWPSGGRGEQLAKHARAALAKYSGDAVIARAEVDALASRRRPGPLRRSDFPR